jgi:serine/threonine protein kinase, bacterial
VAVNAAGDLYVIASLPDTSGVKQMYSPPQQIFRLAAGATSAAPVEFPGVDLHQAAGVAFDAAGNLYVCDRNAVWELTRGSTVPIRLPFRGISQIDGFAVDSAGTVYAIGVTSSSTEKLRHGVKKLPVGATEPIGLPYTDFYLPKAIAVDDSGTIYTSDAIEGAGEARVQKFAPGAFVPTRLPFPTLREADRIAVDAAGDVFVTDSYQKRLFELVSGDSKAVSLPVHEAVAAVAIDGAGNLFFASAATNDLAGNITKPGQVFKLAPN